MLNNNNLINGYVSRIKYRNKLTHIKELAKSLYHQKLLKSDSSSSHTWMSINIIFRKEEKKDYFTNTNKLMGKNSY